jgi:hypothetical protein
MVNMDFETDPRHTAAREKTVATQPPAQEQLTVRDVDMDALHVLPLAIIPFETSAIKRARLVKNAHVESVIEAFQEEGVGQAQVDVRNAAGYFGWESGKGMKDRGTLEQLARLSSFDVYSLRVELRRIKIPIADAKQLQLSAQMRERLGRYMREFTGPLIEKVFGGGNSQLNDINDVIELFRSPDREEAMRNLTRMSQELKIKINEIPDFLEDYGDIYLSISYFKKCFEEIMPKLRVFLNAITELRKVQQCANDRNLMSTCDEMESGLQNLASSMAARFENFDRRSSEIWQNADAESFRKFKDAVTGQHTSMGGVLCGLAVKTDLWEKQFGGDRGGPIQQGEFIRSHMREGMDMIAKIEKSAPSL